MLSDLRECVTGDTLVVLADGRRLPIADLVGQHTGRRGRRRSRSSRHARSEKVWAVGTRPVFTVRLASGRTLRATGKHRIRTGAGWRTSAELVEGDRVGLARQLPEPSRTIRWPDERLVLLGQLVGDGSYLSGQPLRYTRLGGEQWRGRRCSRARVRRAGHRHAGRGNWHQLVIAGNGTRWRPAGVNAWLRELGIFNQRSHEKRLPPEVFQLGNGQIALLLRHLWATTVVSGPGCGAATGASRRECTSRPRATPRAGCRGLLLRLGIVSRRG